MKLGKKNKSVGAYDNYIFDLYGTLVDIHTDETKKGLWEKMAMYYCMHGASYNSKELREKYIELCDRQTKMMPGPDEEVEINLDNVFRRLYEDKLIAPSDELISDTMLMFRTLSTKYIRLYPKTLKMLEELNKRGKNVYLLSNAQASFTIPEMKMLGIYSSFKKIYISSVMGYKKPSKSFFDKLIKEEQLDVNRTLMIGNDLDSDIKGAKEFSIDTLFIKSNISPKKDSVINDVALYSCPMKKAYKKLLEL